MLGIISVKPGKGQVLFTLYPPLRRPTLEQDTPNTKIVATLAKADSVRISKKIISYLHLKATDERDIESGAYVFLFFRSK